MLFTEQYGIKRQPDDDWFDPILDHDTRLFIDPFLVFKTKEGRFATVHQKTVDFFNYVFKIIALSGGDERSSHYKKALDVLLFPEVREICLGYASNSTKGSGSSFGFSSVMASAIWMSIQAGIKQIDHFEKLSIFNEGIGADRISDMTANILKEEFIAYTQEVCKKYNVPLVERRVRNSSFDFENNVWHAEKVLLPINPETDIPVILVPQRYIRPLPTINPEDFWDYICSHENQILRDSFSYHIKGKVNKKDIVELARTHLDAVQRYVESREKSDSKPYNLEKDPNSFYHWYSLGKKVAESNPLKFAQPQSPEDVLVVVESIVKNFQHFIEFQKGYEVLWAEGRARGEGVAQRIFMGVASAYCKANDIDPSKEENLGSGPVDFKFSRGYTKRVLVEVKLANNSKFWNGVSAQLPQYLKTEQITDGVFLVIAYNREDLRRISVITKVVDKVNQDNSVNIRTVTVDARPKPSASKLPNPYDMKLEFSDVNL